MKPIFKHDCDHCKFLGHYNLEESDYDLYFCNKLVPTVIARYGDNGPDYSSGLHFESILPLEEAKKIAVERGLLDSKYLPVNK